MTNLFVLLNENETPKNGLIDILFFFVFARQHHHQLAELGRKQLEQNIQQLQEQLQMNVIQQSHLVHAGDKKKASATLQQLGIQQRQLIQQLQITQSQILIQQGLGLQGHNHSLGKINTCVAKYEIILVIFVFTFLGGTYQLR